MSQAPREWHRPKEKVAIIKDSAARPGSKIRFWPVLFEAFAPVEVRLSPDPRLVRAAHLGFYRMDPAEIPLFCHPAQERTDRHVPAGRGITHLEDHHTPEIVHREIEAADRYAPVFDKRDKPAQDIGSPLLHPGVNVCCSRCNAGAEDPAAEPALLAGLLFGNRIVHRASFHYSSGWAIRVCRQAGAAIQEISLTKPVLEEATVM